MMPITDFPNYAVTEAGEVVSFYTDQPFHKWYDDEGFSCVTLYNDLGRKVFRVDRLVLEAFAVKSKRDIKHINGLKTDDRLENLEYVKIAETVHQKVDDLFESLSIQSGVSVRTLWKILRGFSQ